MNFLNKHVVVTGGANGIGRCTAGAFLREGATVTVIDVDRQAGELLQNRHDGLCFFHGDIAEKSVLEDFVKSLRRPVDCLINNACISRAGLLSDCSYVDFEYVQRVGVTAPYYLTKLLLQNNLLTNNASIVNISSSRSRQSQPDTESYSAAKGGISALTHSMAISLSGRARVNSISPGWIEAAACHETAASPDHSEMDMKQHPVRRVGTPEDISELVLYLCGDKAAFINGEDIAVDGGMSRLMIYNNDHGWSFSTKGC
ncbi:MAG: SDR family oxidoreductase [Defluviitaleaceae bacterium]|nr:SDR family oxidoreductase [Defluviitaleaceae bacterium]